MTQFFDRMLVMSKQAKKKAVRKPKISIRARKYIKNKVAGMSDYQAALKAGYSKAVAVKASSTVEKGRVKEALDKLMDKAGLTDEYLITKAKEGLEEANKIIGTQDNFIEVPDYAVRHKYLETTLRLKGHSKPKDEPPAQPPIPLMQVNIQVNNNNVSDNNSDKEDKPAN